MFLFILGWKSLGHLIYSEQKTQVRGGSLIVRPPSPPGGGGFTGGKQVRRKQRSRVTRWDNEGALMCVTVFSVKKMKK